VEAVSKCLAFSGYKAREDERAGEGGKDSITEKPPGKTQNRGKNRKNFHSSVSSQRNRGGHGERPQAAEEESG